MDEMRLKLLEGQIGLPGIGAVRQNVAGLLPYAVVDEAGREIEVFSVFLRDLVLTDMSPLTVRSYGNDLLRWWRVLELIGVPWDQAGRLEVEVMVGWMRSAVNPQRRGSGARVMNPRTGKRPLAEGYAPATINHALAVLASFYASERGRGPDDDSGLLPRYPGLGSPGARTLGPMGCALPHRQQGNQVTGENETPSQGTHGWPHTLASTAPSCLRRRRDRPPGPPG
ncbi:hypothetical protein [Pseudarthrobacter raffinosi]|uniref:hypothetical protein n=1 Tax=Pseudarthrobacter raffinosi TaxID=2953651 RepID=UPI00208EE15C|nr:hypothetical protein [Pseudarthrobacter sp. MDT3-9]MCO4253457.1 hypothetical protein [Pseudarthrobacter sp. MDT3-9]